MCLAIPSEIVAIAGKMATIDVSGVRREVSLLLLSEDVRVGDFVLIHAGFAIHKMDPEAAEDTLNLLEEMSKRVQASENP
jgi:hydrogenase expression/formation protein HypC